MRDPDAYKPISAYGAIGNLRTVALVGLDGSIDWCCFPVFDAPSTFAAILDQQKGGRFRVAPVRPLSSDQQYLTHTNVLETAFDTEGGRLLVTDFMPLIGSIDNNDPHKAPEEIHRLLEAVSGDVEVEVVWAPRFDYGRETVTIERTPTGFLAHAGNHCLTLGGLPVRGEIAADDYGPMVRARFTISPGDRTALVTRWDSTDSTVGLPITGQYLDETVDAWRRWARKEEATGDRSWAGYWSDHVIRSELALKLMTFAPTGAIVAAPTTSLPEWIGSVRNWDYRYSWIRDSGLAAQALNAMGHMAEAEAFIRWAEEVSRERGEEDSGLRIMYDVRGNHCLPEVELPHFEGYMGSRPVRYGNEAAEQFQLDVYGELISAAYEYARMGRDFEPEIWQFLSQLADAAHNRWPEQDSGIWEVRNGPHHFVYSKVMVWMALNRAAHMAERGMIEGDAAVWRASEAAVMQDVLAKGFDPELNAFTMMYGSKELDAANLLIPLLEFLPFDDPRVQGTIDRTLERLTERDLVYRYHADDGLPGPEGAFVFCTFWMVDALALSGRLDEAYRIFDGLAARVNHVGLLSEQIDPHTGEFLGNFPQAFSHIGMINSALYLAHMEGRKTPVPAPIGSREHRAEIGNPV
jgi:GH15 family glucan-1,4-alpha-glucosidase